LSAQILICAPSVRTDPQQATYEVWRQSLETRGFQLRALRREHYADSPWVLLVDLMAEVDGVVLLGFHQMEISAGVWRSGTAEMAAGNAVWTSPWMQLEAGMAIAFDLPVLAVPERGVAEGVFAPQNWIDRVFGCAANDPRSLVVERWASAVRRGGQRRPRSANRISRS
jgi:hypothetical protein